jgi:hypothetical protein
VIPGWIRRLSPRAEKTVRLVSMCALAGAFGIAAVALDSEALGYAAVAIVLVGILAGPLVARVLFPPENRGR